MNKFEIVKAKLSAYESIKESTEEYLRDYLYDSTQPLEERWNVYSNNHIISVISINEQLELFGWNQVCYACGKVKKEKLMVLHYCKHFCDLTCLDTFNEKNE